jgi:hypothetical protein
MLRQALGSVLDQTDIRLQAIVVDEDSSDDTLAELAQIEDKRLTVVRNEPAKGVARARNEGVARAKADWIAFLDDDDFWAPAKLATQLASAEREGHSWSYCGRIEIDESGAVINAGYCPEPRGLQHRLFSDNVIGPPSSVLMRSDLLEEIGGFDPRLSALADWDMWIRAVARATVDVSPEPLLAYRRHGGGMMVTDGPKMTAEFEQLKAKHSAAAARMGFDFGESWVSRWSAGRNLEAARRLQAARDYLGIAARQRSARDVARALAALGGRRLQRLGRAVQARVTPRPDWLDRYV